MEKPYRELCEEIENLKQQSEAARKRESAAALAGVRRLIAEYRLSPAECGFASASSPKVALNKGIVKIKCRHPENSSLTWIGRKTAEVAAALETQGRRREDFLVHD